ncbi:hypothetical protein P879_03755 [Paragonimus westermani]|uniref:Uncharacterized protein n=1 Tax=Paragonimus westermani TaxID=34504 RepID=A0A8T0DQ88_9TREM|nr:hypothetical protein P879_03755 [Paragonimus westermani]
MSIEQKEWLMAVVSGDEKKMLNMLNANPDLVNWQGFSLAECLFISLFTLYIRFLQILSICLTSFKLLYFAISGGSLQNSALHFAAKFGNCALIRMLVGNHQADVNIRNNGHTPLHWAAASAQKDAIILLTSTYGAKITIRDHSGQLPGAYLPPSKAGNELKKFFKDPIALLLTGPWKELLLRLANNDIPSGNLHITPRSRSNSPVVRDDRHIDDSLLSSPSHVPINSRFPWQPGDGTRRDTQVNRMFSSRSREPSKERTRTKVKSKETHRDSVCGSFGRRRATEHTPLVLKRPTETVGPRGRHPTLTNAALADVINASIQLRRERAQKKYNPLNPELDLSIGGNQPRDSPSSSIRSTTRRRQIHPQTGNARNRSPGPAGPDSDSADPPTPTNDPAE